MDKFIQNEKFEVKDHILNLDIPSNVNREDSIGNDNNKQYNQIENNEPNVIKNVVYPLSSERPKRNVKRPNYLEDYI